MESNEFDFEAFKVEAMDRLEAGKGLLGSEGALTPFIQNLLEEAFECKFQPYIAEQDLTNRKKDKGKLTVCSIRELAVTMNACAVL